MKNDLEKKVMRKVTLRIIPFIMLLYFIAFLDRVNIGFAALTMNQDWHFHPPFLVWALAFSSWVIFCLRYRQT